MPVKMKALQPVHVSSVGMLNTGETFSVEDAEAQQLRDRQLAEDVSTDNVGEDQQRPEDIKPSEQEAQDNAAGQEPAQETVPASEPNDGPAQTVPASADTVPRVG